MKVRVTKGTLSCKHGRGSQDIGFTVLFPSEYAGNLCDSGDLEINVGDGKYVYLSLPRLEETVVRGDLVVLEA